ncbi:S-adenosyl-L-methionine-dependent methyltransferase, partial [Backusella circina FSU 941]
MGNTPSAHSKRSKRSSTVHDSQLEKKTITKSKDRSINGRSYHAFENSVYMLPNDDLETDRLHEQHFIIKELLGFNIMEKAFHTLDFQSQLNVLDICCGPATWLCETSLDYPTCQFSGVDMCNQWPQVIRPVNLNFTQENILNGLPYPDNSFDFIQMRFVVLAFRTHEWSFVISEIRRVLKDGGCFQCIEMDMRSTKFCTSFGLDISAGAKLNTMLSLEHNMNVLQSEYRDLPLGWGGPIGTAYLHTYKGILNGLSPWFNQYLNINDRQTYDHLVREISQELAKTKATMGLHAILVQK